MQDQQDLPLTISNGSLTARIIRFGASLSDLRLESTNTPLVAGYSDPDVYQTDGQFMGAIVGRFANRIANGTARLNGTDIELEKNENGQNHLHGGLSGFWRQMWNIAAVTPTAVKLALVSTDGEAGYPGNLSVTANYEILDPATLRLTINAETDKDTFVNICHHPYFNLVGSGTIDEHELLIESSRYLPSDEALIPTGETADTSGSPFDFSTLRPVPKYNYNNTYCLHDHPKAQLTHAATLQRQPISMQLWTTQPGLHLYDGYKLEPKTRGHSGERYGSRSSICLEAQAWPDSPNHPAFPSTVLEAGDTYTQVTEYRFSKIS